MVEYCVAKYGLRGKWLGIISGMGKNRNTWDSSHSRSRAYYYCRKLRKQDKMYAYKVEKVLY